MEYAAVLGPDDVLTDRPFTDAANTMREVDVMRHMLLYERSRALEWIDIDPGSHTIREHDEEGLILEEGSPNEIFSSPKEPRTQQFLERIIEAGRL